MEKTTKRQRQKDFFVFLCLFVSLWFSSVCYAQEDTQDKVDQKKPSKWQWSLAVVNRTGYRIQEPRVFQMSRTFANGKAIYKFSDHWRLTMEAKLHYDPVERLGLPEKPWLDPRQFLIDGKIKNVGLSIGLQQVVWGQADGLRVLDVINPLDYREFILEDFLDSRRPLWTLRADLPVRSGSLQFIYIPYFAPGRLPGPDDEFGFGKSFGLGSISASPGSPSSLPIAVDVLPSRRPGYRIGASQYGVRYSRSLGAWDLTANFFRGWEDIPTPEVGGFRFFPTPELLIAPRYDRKTVLGGTAVTNFGPVVLRLEAGWNFRKAAPLNRTEGTGFEKLGQFSSVAGIDYSPREWLWLSGQYFLQFTSAPQRDLLFPRYNHLVSFFVRTNFFRETLRPELFVLTGLNRRQYMIRPRLTRKFGDHFSLGIGVDILGGQTTTPFGFFSSRDRAVIELKWLK